MQGFKTLSLVFVMALAFCGLARAEEASTSAATSELKIDQRPKRKFNGEWKFGFGGTSYTEGPDEGAAANFYLDSKLDFPLIEGLYGHFEPYVDLYSGRLQERYNDDSYESRLGLQSGYLGYKPVSFLEGRAGIIRQDFHVTPLLIGKHRGFPGVQEIATFEHQDIKISLMAQQLVPTSYSLNVDRAEKEKLPTFGTQGIQAEGKALGWLGWHANAGHFTWSNLPDKVAQLSGRAGNETDDPNAGPGARFKHGFDGYYWGAKLCYCATGWIGFAGEYFGQMNTQAPSRYRDAQMLGGGPDFYFGDKVLELRYYSYFLESDATVARYYSSSLGYTNRMGDILEAKLDFKKYGFRIKGHLNNARTVINKDNNQQTMTHVYLGVETDYAPF